MFLDSTTLPLQQYEALHGLDSSSEPKVASLNPRTESLPFRCFDMQQYVALNVGSQRRCILGQSGDALEQLVQKSSKAELEQR